jgi:hypothetical protein
VCGTNVVLGRPGRQGDGHRKSDQRLILIGAWRDPSQPHVKKRARFEACCRAGRKILKWRLTPPKKTLVLLTNAG